MVRFKNRYIVVEINPENIPYNFGEYPVQADSVYRAIMNKVTQLHGDFGVSAIKNGFIAKYCNPHLRIALIRVRHGPHRLVTSSLPFINTFRGKKAVFNTLYIGATMRNCFKFLTKYQRKKIDIDLAKLKGTPHYDKLCKDFMDLTATKDFCGT